MPARNTVFLSLALAWAEVLDARGDRDRRQCRGLAIPIAGPNSFTRSNDWRLWPRAGIEGQRFKIETPLIGLSKADIIRLGTSLGLDYALTHSCYDPRPDGMPCGACDSCRIREDGFRTPCWHDFRSTAPVRLRLSLAVAQPLRRQILALNIAVLIPSRRCRVVDARDLQRANQTARMRSRDDVRHDPLLSRTRIEISDIQTVIGTIPLPQARGHHDYRRGQRRRSRSRCAERAVGLKVAQTPLPPTTCRPCCRAGMDDVEQVYANRVFDRGPWLVSAGIPTVLARQRMRPLIAAISASRSGATWLTILLEFLPATSRLRSTVPPGLLRTLPREVSPPKTIRMPSLEMDRLQSTGDDGRQSARGA